MKFAALLDRCDKSQWLAFSGDSIWATWKLLFLMAVLMLMSTLNNQLHLIIALQKGDEKSEGDYVYETEI